MFTTILIPMISTAISAVLGKKEVDVNNQYYEINPVYNSGNILKLEISGIFEMKMIHIINVICKGEWKDEWPSNRGTYDYCYE